jgi:hypothetical protein
MYASFTSNNMQSQVDLLPDPKFARWHSESTTWRNQVLISPAYSPWVSRPTVSLTGVQATDRVKDLLDVTAAQCLLRHRDKKCRQGSEWTRWGWVNEVFSDTSQSHARKAFSNSYDISPCMTTSSNYYSFGLDRAIIPIEHFKMQGLPAMKMALPSGMTKDQVKDLAGNMMFLPSLATVLMAVLLAVDFPEFKNNASSGSSGASRGQ